MIISKTNLKTIIIIFVAIICICSIDTYIRPCFPNYNDQFRGVYHVVAGVIVPQSLKLLSRDESDSIGAYGFGAVVSALTWELSSFMQRGYFQFDQFICDILGIVIFMIFNKSNRFKRFLVQ